MFDHASDLNIRELLSGISVLVPLIGDQYEGLTETDVSAKLQSAYSIRIFPSFSGKLRCYDTIRYDTIGEINMDSKAEYTA